MKTIRLDTYGTKGEMSTAVLRDVRDIPKWLSMTRSDQSKLLFRKAVSVVACAYYCHHSDVAGVFNVISIDDNRVNWHDADPNYTQPYNLCRCLDLSQHSRSKFGMHSNRRD